MKLFITTTDESTAHQLEKEGFQLIEDSSNRWVFLNNAGLFATTKASLEKLCETDRVCI